MKRLESNLKNMSLSLTIVALAAAALLGGLYVLTEEPIARQKAEKQQKAITSVLPATEGIEIAEPEMVDGMTLYKAYAGGKFAGAAVQAEENGFGGKFKVMVGFDKDGNIVNYEVLEHQETPGLGDHMVSWFKTDKGNQSVIGRSPATANFTVGKDGGDVDAITAATISSRAFLKAVCHAYEAYADQQADAESGATALSEATEIAETADITAGEDAAGNETSSESNNETPVQS